MTYMQRLIKNLRGCCEGTASEGADVIEDLLKEIDDLTAYTATLEEQVDQARKGGFYD